MECKRVLFYLRKIVFVVKLFLVGFGKVKRRVSEKDFFYNKKIRIGKYV